MKQLVNKVDVRFTEEDNLLLVETQYPNMSNCKCKYSVEYKIFTPKQTTLDLNSTYSSITNVPQSDILIKSEKRYSTTAIGTIGDDSASNSHIKISANRQKITIRQ